MGALEEQLANAKSSYEKANTEEDKEYWRERIVQINNALAEEEDTYLSYVEAVGEAANQILTNKIEKAFKEAEKNVDNLLNDFSKIPEIEAIDDSEEVSDRNINAQEKDNFIIEKDQEEVHEEIEETLSLLKEKKSLIKSVFTNRKINEEISWKIHCCKKDDTYQTIANKYKIEQKKLMSLNNNEKIEEAYVDSLNNPKLKKDFKESHIDIAEYLIRNYSYYKADDWYDFYYNQVCKIAILWCKNNNIRYKMSKKC